MQEPTSSSQRPLTSTPTQEKTVRYYNVAMTGLFSGPPPPPAMNGNGPVTITFLDSNHGTEVFQGRKKPEYYVVARPSQSAEVDAEEAWWLQDGPNTLRENVQTPFFTPTVGTNQRTWAPHMTADGAPPVLGSFHPYTARGILSISVDQDWTLMQTDMDKIDSEPFEPTFGVPGSKHTPVVFN